MLNLPVTVLARLAAVRGTLAGSTLAELRRRPQTAEAEVAPDGGDGQGGNLDVVLDHQQLSVDDVGRHLATICCNRGDKTASGADEMCGDDGSVRREWYVCTGNFETFYLYLTTNLECCGGFGGRSFTST